MMTKQPKGVALLIAILLATVSLLLGISLLDIAYKQVVLASTAKNSYLSFYAADTALECALYWDQAVNEFAYSDSATSGTITCNNTSVTYTASRSGSGASAVRISRFNMPCSNSTTAAVTVYKYASASTTIYANGYNNCSTTDGRRIERSLRASY